MEKLKTINKPSLITRSVIHGSGDKVPPLITGDGTVSYACGKCNSILAKNVWQNSVRNILVECPKCSAYNEFIPLKNDETPSVRLTEGDFYFTDAIKLKLNAILEGTSISD